MELARVLRELMKRPRLLALGAAIAVIAAVFSVYQPRWGQAEAQVAAVLLRQHPGARGFERLGARQRLAGVRTAGVRAQVYANFMTSPAFLESSHSRWACPAHRSTPPDRSNQNEPRVEREPTELKRNVEITGETKPYRLDFESQAGTADDHDQLPGANDQPGRRARKRRRDRSAALRRGRGVLGRLPANSRVVIRQLGSATGAVVDGGISKTLMVIVFLAVFALWCVLMLVARRFREVWRASAALQGHEASWRMPSDGHVDGSRCARRRGARGAQQRPVYDPRGAPLLRSPKRAARPPGRGAGHR